MKVLSAICMILGCFLGAGFVSGREIACYFSKFGYASVISCFFVGILFFVLICFFFLISNRVKNLSEFISYYFTKSSKFIEWLLIFCIVVLTGSMIAGVGAFADSLNYDKILILNITIILCFFIVMNNVKGLAKTNNFIVPFLVIILILSMDFCGSLFVDVGENIVPCVIDGCVYVFINIISLGLLIIEIGHGFSKKEKIFISIVCSVVIMLLLFGLNFSIISNDFESYIMPNLELSKKNNLLYFLMQVSVYLGLFTTLISNVFVLTNFMCKKIGSYILSLVCVLCVGIIVSFIGFERLIGCVYVVIGINGLGIVINAIKKESKNKFSSFNNSV